VKKQIIVITGAGKGIGFATTKYLLSQKNVNVIAISRNTNALEKLNLSGLQIIQADITTETGKILSAIGKQKIDGLINNAGNIIKKKFNKLEYQDFESIYQTNVFAAFDLCVKILPNLKKGSHIVNIGSMGGVENTLKFPEMVFYSSSKAALHCLSQCLSVEFKKFNISVNCLALGSVETEMVKLAFPGFKPPVQAKTMAEFIGWFIIHGHRIMNGQILPVALTTP